LKTDLKEKIKIVIQICPHLLNLIIIHPENPMLKVILLSFQLLLQLIQEIFPNIVMINIFSIKIK
jgi:hypothetical protein